MKTKAQLIAELETAQKRIEKLERALKKKPPAKDGEQEKLTRLLETLPVGVSILDADRKVVYENAALQQILDLSAEELRTGAYKNRKYLSADGSPMPSDGFASAQAQKSGGPVYDVETGIVKEDGETIWANVSAIPVDFPDWKTIIVTADITPRKQAEKILQDERRNLEALIENTDGSIWSVDAQYRLIVGNARYHHDTSAALGRKLVEGESVLVTSFPPAALAEWRGYYDRALQGENFSVEVQTRFANPVHYVEYRFNPIRTGTGAIVGVTVFGRDITERKQAEDTIRESQELFSKAFRSNPGAMVISRLADGLLMDFNSSYEQIFEYTREELIGKTSTSVNIIDPEARHVIIEKLQADGHVHGYETTFRTKSGKLINALFSIEKIELAGEQCMLTIIYDITERKLAEKKLRDSEEFLRLAYEAADLGIWKNDLQTGSVEFDERARSHYGFDTLHTTLAEVTSRIHPDDVARLGAEIAAATAPTGSGKFTTEYRVMHPNGNVHWLAIGVRVTFEGEGEARQALMGYGTSLDITERKRAEEALRQSQQKYSVLFEKAAVPAALTKMPEGVFADVNEAFQKIFGYSREDVIGKTSVEIGMARPEEREHTALELKQHDQLRDNEKHLYTKTGEARTALINVGKARIDDQEYVITTIHDVTEQKRAESALQLSRESFTKAFESNPAALVITRRADGKLIRINSAYTRMIGYAPAEIIGRFAGEVNIYANLADRQEVMRLLQEQGSVRDHEILIRSKSGEIRSMVVFMEPLEFEGENCILSALLDITDRKRTEEELRRSNAELEQFAYIASHDLQEPLRTLAGMVQLLQKRYQGQLDERADEYIGHAVESAARMQALIRDLLAYSRVDRKNQPIAMVSAQDCLQTALKNLGASIRESGAVIVAEGLPIVHADSSQLTQLFQNLIGNSIKFRGERQPHVQITATQLNDAWQFAVSDNGIGIEAQYYERIFLVFQRLHTRRQYQGTGIGLALCKKIVERHGGSIRVESRAGEGSTFYFTLPIRSTP